MRVSRKSLYLAVVGAFGLAGIVNAQEGVAPSNAPPIVAPYFDSGPHSNDPIARINVARTALSQKNYAEARRVLAPMYNLGFQNPEIYSLTGLAYLGLGKPSTAANFLDVAVRRSGYEDVGANHGLALAYIAKGDLKRAGVVTARLQRQAEKCANICPKAAELKTALASIDRASN